MAYGPRSDNEGSPHEDANSTISRLLFFYLYGSWKHRFGLRQLPPELAADNILVTHGAWRSLVARLLWEQ